MIATPTKPGRIELILRQIDSLPTLPAVATRLLGITADDTSDARDVIQVIGGDPSLTAKVLSLCRAADKGLREEVITVERAVVLLGFNAIRNAVLSVKVFELYGPGARPGRGATGGGRVDPAAADEVEAFDRRGFWAHSLAVGILAERLVAFGAKGSGGGGDSGGSGGSGGRGLDPSEAFVCGLLHDIGKLALEHVLPQSYARVLELTDLNSGNIAEFERRVIGMDHHTAGKRLAEQWGLPHRLQDAVWLHGTPYDTLPKLPHQRLIGVVTLADLLAREQHVGYSGNHSLSPSAASLMEKLGIAAPAVERAVSGLHRELECRGKALGLHDEPSERLFLQSIQRANETLGRLNLALERRGRAATAQARVLEAIATFHANTTPGMRVQDVLDATVDSARAALGPGFYAMLYPCGRGDEINREQAAPDATDAPTWLVGQYNAEGRPVHAQFIEAPPHAPDLRRMEVGPGSVSLDLMGILPWIADYLIDASDLRKVRLLPLSCGWGMAALMIHDREQLPHWSHLQPLAATWGAAIAAAAQFDGARRLGEELAQANSALADAQDRLLRQESLARLGEMSAGAAHEMNNPLTVISGRGQLLASTTKPGTMEHKAAQTICREAHRLSDLITCLRMFADPPRAQRQLVDLGALLDETVKQVARDQIRENEPNPITLQVRQPMPLVSIDADMVRRAVSELVANALQAKPRSVQVVVRLDPSGRSVLVQVADDGEGMDAYALAHAMDPFFSAKPAGRQVGMGLPRAQQLAAAHGGEVGLRSTPGKGTVATLTLPLDSPA